MRWRLEKGRKLVKRMAVQALQTLFVWLGQEETLSLSHTGTVLVIAPHPDDETLGCGAAIARLRSMGVRVRIVIVTDGGASTDSALLPSEKRADTRRREAQEAARILGVPETELVFLGYPDEKASLFIDKIASDLAAQLWLCAPSLVLAPHGNDGHADHRAVSNIVGQLQTNGKIACRVLEYPMWFWPSRALSHLRQPGPFRKHKKIAADEFLAIKRQAAAAHHSQFENLTQEPEWQHLDQDFFEQNMRPYELFFERTPPSA